MKIYYSRDDVKHLIIQSLSGFRPEGQTFGMDVDKYSNEEFISITFNEVQEERKVEEAHDPKVSEYNDEPIDLSNRPF